MTENGQKRALLVTHNDVYGLLMLNQVAPVLAARGFAIEICLSTTSEKTAHKWRAESETMHQYRLLKNVSLGKETGFLGQVMQLVDRCIEDSEGILQSGRLLTFKELAEMYAIYGKFSTISGGELGGKKFHDSEIVQGHLKGRGDVFLSLDPTTVFDGRTVDYLETNGIARMGIHPGFLPFFQGLHNTVAALLKGQKPFYTVFKFGEGLDKQESAEKGGLYRAFPVSLPPGATVLQYQATQYFEGTRTALEILLDVISGRLRHKKTRKEDGVHAHGATTEREVQSLLHGIGIEVYNLESFIAMMAELLPPGMGIDRLPRPDFIEQKDFDVAVAAVTANAAQTRWVGEMVDGITKGVRGRVR